MYFFDIDIFIKQLLPPHWRYVKTPDGEGGFEDKEQGKFYFLKAVMSPIKSLLNDFKLFRASSKAKVNLNAQVMVIEHHVKTITGAIYGVYVTDHLDNQFKVNVPVAHIAHSDAINSFLKKVTPLGRKYTINFY